MVFISGVVFGCFSDTKVVVKTDITKDNLKIFSNLTLNCERDLCDTCLFLHSKQYMSFYDTIYDYISDWISVR